MHTDKYAGKVQNNRGQVTSEKYLNVLSSLSYSVSHFITLRT